MKFQQNFINKSNNKICNRVCIKFPESSEYVFPSQSIYVNFHQSGVEERYKQPCMDIIYKYQWYGAVFRLKMHLLCNRFAEVTLSGTLSCGKFQFLV